MNDRVAALPRVLDGIAESIREAQGRGSPVDEAIRGPGRGPPLRVKGQEMRPQEAFKLREQAADVGGFQRLRPPPQVRVVWEAGGFQCPVDRPLDGEKLFFNDDQPLYLPVAH